MAVALFYLAKRIMTAWGMPVESRLHVIREYQPREIGAGSLWFPLNCRIAVIS
jgi:hypothetical protein